VLDLDDEPAAVAAFVLWAYDASLPHEVGPLDTIDGQCPCLDPLDSSLSERVS
jgi:hypothetical protein